MKLDAYAPFQLARDHRLSSSEWPVLVALVLLADFRSHEWKGAIGELVKDTRQSTHTVRKAIWTLERAGLVEVLSRVDGEQGPELSARGQPTELRIVAYDTLVVPERRGRDLAQISASGDGTSRADQREPARADLRAPLAHRSRSAPADQRERAPSDLQRRDAARKRGCEEVADVSTARVPAHTDDESEAARLLVAFPGAEEVEVPSSNGGRRCAGGCGRPATAGDYCGGCAPF